MRKFRITKLLAVMALLLVAPMMAFPPAAHAVPTLFLYDVGTNTLVTVADNGAGDTNATLGVINFNGVILGTVWNVVNVTTGITKPALGSASVPWMDLNSVNVSSGGAGTLNIAFTDDSFGVGAATPYVTHIGGTTGGTVSYQLLLDSNNNLPGWSPVGAMIASLGPYNAGAFSGTASGTLLADNAFALTQLVTVTHGAGTVITSFDAETKVPLPASVLLMGTGLLGLVGLGWRRRKK